MRSMKVAFVLASALSVAMGLAGCSADATGGGDDPDASPDQDASKADASGHDAASHDTGSKPDATETDAGNDSTTGGDDGGTDATLSDGSNDGNAGDDGSITDASAVDVIVVAPGDAGAPGSECSPQNAIQQQSCGFCGTQERVCLPSFASVPDGGDAAAVDAGPPVWQPWGFCQNQPDNACQPGTQTTEACGMCGHRTKVCQLDCQWAASSCQGEPANACDPGSTNFVDGLSCPTGQGRSATCTSTCTWGNFGVCTTPDYGAPVVISQVAAGVATAVRKMNASPTLPPLDNGVCPAAISTPSGKNAYTYVRVQNPTAKTAKVSIWLSKAPGGQDIDTQIAVYPDSVSPPLSTTARQACIHVIPSSAQDVNNYCYSSKSVATECLIGWGGLVADDSDDYSLTIAPHKSLWVYAGATEPVSSTSPHAGNFQINARTESLQ